MDILDKIWSMYEICGVSMLDISVWKWMYAHPNATAGELQEAVIRLSKEIWNKYYAPVFGVKDETVLAIYSHMIGYPLYLSAYASDRLSSSNLRTTSTARISQMRLAVSSSKAASPRMCGSSKLPATILP